MKTRLLYPDRDFEWSAAAPWNGAALTVDLALTTLFDTMAQGDACVFDAARKVLLSGVRGDLETIRYRQEIIRDCLDHPEVLRAIYSLVVEAKEKDKGHYLGSLKRYPHWVLRDAIEQMEMFAGMFGKLRKLIDLHEKKFASRGLTNLCAMLQREFDDAYLARIGMHLQQLRFPGAMVLSAALDRGNKASNYVLHRVPDCGETWWQSQWRMLKEALFPPKSSAPGFTLHPRDEGGVRALEILRDQGISNVAAALAQSRDHIRNFFSELRQELAFYVGCVNLCERLTQKGEPVCLPEPMTSGDADFSFRGLYDACLALNLGQRVVGNDANADGRTLIIVTGANQGGKSTFLRSVGLAQLMMQCGMFVPAQSFRSAICTGLFTHYRREEDASMKSGRFDEELGRMSEIVECISPDAMVLLNEPFAATNEREGSEIGRQVMTALSDKSIRVICVTHLFELAHGLYKQHLGNALFLRAERQADGVRTFKLMEGEPLPTSHGPDLYDSIFGTDTREWRDDDSRSAARTA
ncbi:MAG TPA: hypothetical protein VMF67_14225 [Rhizomicrobium sp.]|nr:hypothetical protein [Rhizomicrobium sp.]